MKVNPTVALTFILLVLMFGAGMVSGSWGFAIGREALKGITQPDVRPTSNIGNRKGAQPHTDEIEILKESDVLKSVKAQMEGKTVDDKKEEAKK